MAMIGGRYEMGALIGSGAMGDVHRGRDVQTGDQVALKVLKRSIRDADLIERFVREGEALRELDHPNITKLLAYVEESERQVIVMEFVPGGDLQSLLAAHPDGLPVQRALSIALDLADALTRAHRLNIIHRDLKPANVLIAEDGTPRLTDFGVAHIGNQTELTTEGMVVGTYAYLSPEAVLGLPADARSDIWAFGIILYEMLTGEPPFTGQSPGTIINAILNMPVPDLKMQRPDASDDVLDLVYRMLEKNRENRIPSVRIVGAEVEAILQGRAVPVDLTPQTARLTSLRTSKRDLPSQTTPFVGRQAELAELDRLISAPEQRLITVLGPGGMGKTRLAIEAAAHAMGFSDGVFFARLAPLNSPEGIPAAIAEAIGYTFTEEPSPREQILTTLADKTLLLVMDNFEHIIEGAGLVADILEAAPGVTIIVTSRERLNLAAETVFAIGGMDFPDWETPEDALQYSAVQLFMQSARRVRVDFTLEADDLAYVARICRLVGGMPLGILLAAAWVDVLPLAEIAEEIAGSLDFLESQLRDLPERQRSMRAVFAYSWALLDEDEREALMRMSVFRGGSTRKAAQTVSGAGLRLLTALANKSLLTRNSASGRYATHELIRQFAEEHLTQSGSEAEARRAHAEYFLTWLAGLETDLRGARQKGALDAVEADFENIASAWRYAVGTERADLIGQALTSLRLFTRFRSRFEEGYALVEAARDRWPAAGDVPELLAGRLLAAYPPRGADLAETLERALAIVTDHQSAADIAFVTNQLGRHLAHMQVDLQRGLALLHEALAQYRAMGSAFDEARVLDDLSFALSVAHRDHERLAMVNESIAIRRRIGDRIGLGNALRNLGGTYQVLANLNAAHQAYAEGAAIAAEMGDRVNEAWCVVLLSEMDMMNGNFEAALAKIERGKELVRETNVPDVEYLVDIIEALYMAVMGQAEEALAVAQRVINLRGDDMIFTSFVLVVRLFAYCELGRFDDAIRQVTRWGKDDETPADHPAEAAASVTAQTFARQGAWFFPLIAIPAAFKVGGERAVRWLARVSGPDMVSEPFEAWPFYQRRLDKLREELGEARFEALWAEGLTLDANSAFVEIVTLVG